MRDEEFVSASHVLYVHHTSVVKYIYINKVTIRCWENVAYSPHSFKAIRGPDLLADHHMALAEGTSQGFGFWMCGPSPEPAITTVIESAQFSFPDPRKPLSDENVIAGMNPVSVFA